jgi:hypothetical protein
MKIRFYILPLLLLCTSMLFAQNTKFAATASQTEVGTGQQFEVDFTVDGGGSHFIPPDFNGFQVLAGPNISQSMTSINGATSFTTQYGYILAAASEGTYTITAAAIVVNGHTLTSNPLKIRVKGKYVAPAQPQQAQQPAAPADNGTVDTKDLSKSIFLRASIDKSRAYVGEAIKVTYKLYTRVDILGAQADKAPDLNGFWSQDIARNPNTSWRQEIFNGQRYTATIIKQTIIFPEHAGDLTIDPLAMTFDLRIKLPSRDVLDDLYGNYRDIKYQAKSLPLTVHATPLPDAGKPANFGGAVGSFSAVSDVDKSTLKANETINYTFEITGKGNLNLINSPNINAPADFEKYDPKTNDHITVDSNGVTGSRQFSYLLIPRHKGDYPLSPLDFTYFNPATQRYVTLRTKGFNIHVDKGDAQADMPAFNSADQQDIAMLGKDIRYIKTSTADLYKDGDGFYGSALYYILILLGPIAFISAFYYRRWYEKNNSDIVKVKSRKANKIAAKHLAVASTELKAGNKKAFYEAIARGLYGYLSDKFNIPVADLNRENIIDELKAQSLDDASINKLVDTMDLCEMARYSPVKGISEQEVFDKAKNIISEIEDKI